jgi:glucose/arabinose dehydrogenase
MSTISPIGTQYMFEVILYKIKSYFTLAVCSIMPSLGCAATPPETLSLNLPTGFEATIYAKLDVMPRMMTFDSKGNLFVSSAKSNQIIMLADSNHDGIADTSTLISKELNAPNGLTFLGDHLLVANQNGVVKLIKENNTWSKPQPFISDLASGGHTLKTIKIGSDNHLYINIGSSCNVCIESDSTRATILRYTLDGKPAGALPVVGRHTALPPVWAKGLRNAQGFAWHPITGEMFATNNGADMRSASKDGPINDELPPEHINQIKRGEHYGWPHCWGNQVTDPNFPGSEGFCNNTTKPAIMLTSHSTPIGITFLNKSNFPSEFKQDAIVALHGSWNREALSGYKLVRIKFNDGKPTEVVDFATGWLNNNKAWGRPVDVAIGPDGALYVTDDRTGYIVRITYKNMNDS